MKKSAGILLYKKEKEQIMVLLAHFGGPYWENKDQEAAIEANIPFIFASYGFGNVTTYDYKIESLSDLLKM
ncbi:MAG: hypothetical protein SOU84_06635 [Candidatus Faecimonas sp.]|nr:hypothetical protein [Mycoplasmatota bacterium]MDY2908810.1 hypothetical protein [Candidatus Faecimonas sp.]